MVGLAWVGGYERWSRCARVRWFALLFAAGVSLPASPALAEPSAEDRATARQLAQEGYEALKKEEFELAADRFRRAEELVHAPTLLVDLARSLVGLGRLVEAHETYQIVIREGVTDNVPWPWKKAYENAIKEDRALEPRLAWVTINVYGHDAPTVKIDGRGVAEAAIGVKRAIDPGRRTIVVEAPGHYPAETTVELAEGSATRIDMTLLEEGEEAPAEPARVTTETTPSAAGSSTKRTMAYVAFGIGAAGLVTAGVSSALMLDKRSKLNDACDAERRCPSSAEDELAAYHAFGTVSAVALGVGVAGGLTGLSLLLFTKDEPAQTEAASLRPLVAPGFVGVDGRF